ncbi:MAG: hypothetical protein JNN01_16160 [Opitutaceae bacterium]|nr:hypothetical protein [Opitutaceae bacterium]
MHRLPLLLRALLFMALGAAAGGAGPSYGTLPPGMLSRSELSEVSAEICRDHVFDPSIVSRRLPPGYRLVTLAEQAKDDPALGEFLRAHPGYSSHALGSLCFMSVGSFTVDGVRVHPPGHTPMAFWWARAEGPRDARMRGESTWIQLGSWYSHDLTERARILATDPMAQFTDIQVAEEKPHVWRLRLVLPDEVIAGEVRCSGQPMRRHGPEPGYMSVPFSGDHAGKFWVISYFGHHELKAQGDWQGQGSGVFTTALQVPQEAKAFGTVFQLGWSALSGLYQRNP